MLTFRPPLQHLRQPAPLHVWAQLHVPNIRGRNATLHSSLDVSSGDFDRVSLVFSLSLTTVSLNRAALQVCLRDSGRFRVKSALNAGLVAAQFSSCWAVHVATPEPWRISSAASVLFNVDPDLVRLVWNALGAQLLGFNSIPLKAVLCREQHTGPHLRSPRILSVRQNRNQSFCEQTSFSD
jgi:hypothetical protein